MERARQGDVEAFGVLVTRYRRRAVRLAYGLAGADAEDAVQEAFVKAYRALGRFRAGAPFAPWLFRIVTNEASNRRRSAGRRDQLALRVANRRPSGGAAPSPEEAVIADDQRRELARAMATLPDRDREVLACRWFAELTESEIADVLGCRAGTVKSRLSRALDRLRAALPEEALR